MHFTRYILLLAVVIFLAACSASKVITSSKTSAGSFENSGSYAQAVAAWTDYFAQTSVEQTSAEDFAHAAQTAFKAGKKDQAVSWFDQARYKNYADAAMYETLAQIYKSEDNLSKELSSLETYTEKFGNGNSNVSERLFSIYSEIGESEKALANWNLMNTAARSEKDNLVNYFLTNKKLEHENVCDSVAGVLLNQDAEQTDALEWMAKKYYWAGQNRYDREMKAYDQNKTRKQYNILLKELDQVTADFKKALPFLEKLWQKNQSKEYASYFANIYARFGDEKKADYYKNKMK